MDIFVYAGYIKYLNILSMQCNAMPVTGAGFSPIETEELYCIVGDVRLTAI
jgi:hypothetical protein